MPSENSIRVSEIKSNQVGFGRVAQLSIDLNQFQYKKITLDMKMMTWCDGNMCAPLGAVLYRAGRKINSMELKYIPASVETLLCKNGFLTNYGRARREDIYGTTIQYQRFEPQDDRVFSYYIDDQFRNKALPEMTKALRKKFLEGLLEIFSNAAIHSETKMGIFVCGQHFPRQHKLDFTVTDLGIGIKQNLYSKLTVDLSAERAINWAMEGKNTTKRGPIPGGLGLKLLREFIHLNKGRLQVASDTGYWEQHPDGSVDMNQLPARFPGTVVNIEINTADQQAYALSSEVPDEVPF